MGVEIIAFNHIQRDGAMGKKHFTGLWVDAGRVGLEAGNSCQSADYHHGQHGWHIALAAGNDAVAVEPS